MMLTILIIQTYTSIIEWYFAYNLTGVSEGESYVSLKCKSILNVATTPHDACKLKRENILAYILSVVYEF